MQPLQDLGGVRSESTIRPAFVLQWRSVVDSRYDGRTSLSKTCVRTAVSTPTTMPPCTTFETINTKALKGSVPDNLSTIPPELRLKIYAHLFTSPLPAQTMPHISPPPISRVSRLLRHETLPLFFKKAQIIFQCDPDPTYMADGSTAALAGIAPDVLANITHLTARGLTGPRNMAFSVEVVINERCVLSSPFAWRWAVMALPGRESVAVTNWEKRCGGRFDEECRVMEEGLRTLRAGLQVALSRDRVRRAARVVDGKSVMGSFAREDYTEIWERVTGWEVHEEDGVTPFR